MAGGTSTCETRMREVLDAIVIGLPDGHGVRGRGGFESDGEEDDLLLRIRFGELEGIERRVDDAHVARLRPWRRTSSSHDPGTRSMSPKEQKIASGRLAMATALSISSIGVTQTGQPGP